MKPNLVLNWLRILSRESWNKISLLSRPRWSRLEQINLLIEPFGTRKRVQVVITHLSYSQPPTHSFHSSSSETISIGSYPVSPQTVGNRCCISCKECYNDIWQTCGSHKIIIIMIMLICVLPLMTKNWFEISICVLMQTPCRLLDLTCSRDRIRSAKVHIYKLCCCHHIVSDYKTEPPVIRKETANAKVYEIE